MINRLFLCLLPLSLFAINGTAQFRLGYYYPEAHMMRELYYSGGVEGEFEAAANVYKDLSVFANTGIFRRTGHSIGLNSQTNVQIYPLSIGLKYNVHLNSRFDLYLGAAPTYTWALFEDYSPGVKQNTTKSQFGVVAKAGSLIFLSKRIFLDVFFDYYYTDIPGTNFPGVVSTSIDIGGFRTGVGLGAKF